MTITTFVRKENKYLLTEEQKSFLLSHLNQYTEYDKYCQNGNQYIVNNIYFDTDTFNVIRNSLAKPAYKAKLRMRTYGAEATDNHEAFLEVKKKIAGVVNKRRVVMRLEDLKKYLQEGIRPINCSKHQTQVFNEIDYILAYEKVEPKVYLSYKRIALYDKENPQLRLTIDEDIITRVEGLDLSLPRYGKKLLPENRYLMEIKAIGAYPMWLAKLLSQAKIYPTSFSKYGTFYQNYVKEQINHE